ncbi:hypothetical protein PGT21_013254 [Puccinia graminis f. sp. tritici]|uniref:Uncharacterized protein n=1 Tax=Puccinia graminis f. sp. tritici TaxID=56615 RepID=A0A5B0QN06_PUCGR|nr:hypothetical protein PGT21_013254 [Puccinia graminis f. sp. tritici]
MRRLEGVTERQLIELPDWSRRASRTNARRTNACCDWETNHESSDNPARQPARADYTRDKFGSPEAMMGLRNLSDKASPSSCLRLACLMNYTVDERVG